MAVGDYEWFITLAELQHVTAAAEQLHVAQPTLTRMLARLEQRLGVALFDRHGRRLSSTPTAASSTNTRAGRSWSWIRHGVR